MPGSKCFGHAPRLCKATTRRVWRITVEDLTDSPDAGILEMRREALEQAQSLAGIAVDAEMGERKRAQQPAPDCPLMIDGVAFPWSANVPAGVAGMGACQTAQPHRGQQFTSASFHNRSFAC